MVADDQEAPAGDSQDVASSEGDVPTDSQGQAIPEEPSSSASSANGDPAAPSDSDATEWAGALLWGGHELISRDGRRPRPC